MNTEQTPAAEDVEALKTAQAELAAARAQQSDDQALIAHLKLQIAKLNRERFGPHAERTARLLDQMELQLEELEVIQHVREKFTCRDCEKISQVPAPFHVIARGWAGPSLLAMIAFQKFGQHQPLNRQAERYAKEDVPLSLSPLAD